MIEVRLYDIHDNFLALIYVNDKKFIPIQIERWSRENNREVASAYVQEELFDHKRCIKRRLRRRTFF